MAVFMFKMLTMLSALLTGILCVRARINPATTVVRLCPDYAIKKTVPFLKHGHAGPTGTAYRRVFPFLSEMSAFFPQM